MDILFEDYMRSRREEFFSGVGDGGEFFGFLDKSIILEVSAAATRLRFAVEQKIDYPTRIEDEQLVEKWKVSADRTQGMSEAQITDLIEKEVALDQTNRQPDGQVLNSAACVLDGLFLTELSSLPKTGIQEFDELFYLLVHKSFHAMEHRFYVFRSFQGIIGVKLNNLNELARRRVTSSFNKWEKPPESLRNEYDRYSGIVCIQQEVDDFNIRFSRFSSSGKSQFAELMEVYGLCGCGNVALETGTE